MKSLLTPLTENEVGPLDAMNTTSQRVISGSEWPFVVAGTAFAAVRYDHPRIRDQHYWRLKIVESGEILEAGAGGISTESRPKMVADMEDLLVRAAKGDFDMFRDQFRLPPRPGRVVASCERAGIDPGEGIQGLREKFQAELESAPKWLYHNDAGFLAFADQVMDKRAKHQPAQQEVSAPEDPLEADDNVDAERMRP